MILVLQVFPLSKLMDATISPCRLFPYPESISAEVVIVGPLCEMRLSDFVERTRGIEVIDHYNISYVSLVLR